MNQEQPKKNEKDTLTQHDVQGGMKTFEKADDPHPELDTPDRKNNGAEPAVYQNQRKAQT